MMDELKPNVREGFRTFCTALFAGGPMVDDITLAKNAKQLVDGVEQRSSSSNLESSSNDQPRSQLSPNDDEENEGNRPTNKERPTDKKVERKEILQYKTINHSLMQETTIKLKAIKVKDLLQTYNICFVFIKISLHSYVYP